MKEADVVHFPKLDTLLKQTASRFRLQPRLHTFRENGHRIVGPEETTNRIRSILKGVGEDYSAHLVSTKLGSILSEHFFVHQASMDSLFDNFGKNYSLGKGLTPEQSLASAFCELVERFSAMYEPKDAVTRGSVVDLKARYRILHPHCIGIPRIRQLRGQELDLFVEEQPIDWVVGWDLLAEEPLLVPLAYSHLFSPIDQVSPNRLVEPRPNGIACGNCMEEALLQGIFEVVERDAQAIFTWNQLPMPEVLLDTLPVEENKTLGKALAALHASDLQVILKDITTDTKVPTLYAFGVDESGEGPAFQWGVGSHLDPGVAVSRAITELFQARAKLLEHMSRIPKDPGDLDSWESLRYHPEAARILRLFYLESKGLVEYIQHSKRSIPFQEIPDLSHPDIAEEVRICLEYIRAAGFNEVIAVDLTRPAIGFPVVRIFIPSAEFIPWSDYEVEREGERRLTSVPPLLGYKPSVDYVEGSGRDGNFLI